MTCERTLNPEHCVHHKTSYLKGNREENESHSLLKEGEEMERESFSKSSTFIINDFFLNALIQIDCSAFLSLPSTSRIGLLKGDFFLSLFIIQNERWIIIITNVISSLRLSASILLLLFSSFFKYQKSFKTIIIVSIYLSLSL